MTAEIIKIKKSWTLVRETANGVAYLTERHDSGQAFGRWGGKEEAYRFNSLRAAERILEDIKENQGRRATSDEWADYRLRRTIVRGLEGLI